MTTLAWGLLGTARINRRLVPAMRAARRSTIAAVASRDGRRAEACAREYQIPTAHGSYEALLRDRAVTAIYIPLPNTLHVEWTLRALDAGKHVLCEKPLALSPEDVDRVAAVARASGLVVAEGFMFRHEPLVSRVVTAIAEGAIGTLRSITAGFTFQQDRTPDVRLDPALGGGSLWDVGCYAVNAARLVAGAEPLAVCGVATRSSAHGVDEAFAGLLQFPAGVIGMVQSGFRSPYRTWLTVTGSDGTLHVARPFRPEPLDGFEIQRGDERSRIEVEGSPHLFVRMVEDFVAAALDGRAPAVSLADSRGNAATLAALYASAASGRLWQI